jgi:hypothetical protein
VESIQSRYRPSSSSDLTVPLILVPVQAFPRIDLVQHQAQRPALATTGDSEGREQILPIKTDALGIRLLAAGLIFDQ